MPGPINVMDDVVSSRFILEDSTVKGKEMKERNARTSCKGTKAECCPPVFTEASGIDVLPRLPIEQGPLQSRHLPLRCEQSQGSESRRMPCKPAAPLTHE